MPHKSRLTIINITLGDLRGGGPLAATGTYNLTASVTWDACWALGPATPGGPPPGCKPVPGAAGLAASTTAPRQVHVREIQSVNNG